MTGGIYCEVHLTSFDKQTLTNVRQKMQQLFAAGHLIPRGDSLTQQIINYWYNNVSRKMGRILSSWSVPTNRGYYNRTVDLTRSICLGVYSNGKLRRMYRFSGGRSEALPRTTSKRHHPVPAERAESFLSEYQLVHAKGFSIVIAATMPYAVRLEKEYSRPVLLGVISRIIKSIQEFATQDKDQIYGYIFESTGGFES